MSVGRFRCDLPTNVAPARQRTLGLAVTAISRRAAANSNTMWSTVCTSCALCAPYSDYSHQSHAESALRAAQQREYIGSDWGGGDYTYTHDMQ